MAEMESFQLYSEIKYYAEKGVYHPLTLSDENPESRKAAINRSSKSYIVKDNRLYYHFRSNLRLVVMSMEERDQVLRECHDRLAPGEHPGRHRTVEKIKASYHWASIRADTNKWVEECPQCQHNGKVQRASPVLHPFKVTRAWSVLGIDLIGPLPKTSKGNSFIVTMTDLFTNWVIAKPIFNKTAAEVVKKIVSVLLDFGLVEQMITDRGPTFVNKVNRGIFEVFGITHCITSACRPQSNGQDETMNQTIKRALTESCGEDQNDWDLHLKGVVSAINSSKQRSTKYTPYSAMFGRNPRTPGVIDANQMTGDFVAGDPEENLEERTAEIPAKIYENIQASQDKPKKDFKSRKRRNVKCQEGLASRDDGPPVFCSRPKRQEDIAAASPDNEDSCYDKRTNLYHQQAAPVHPPRAEWAQQARQTRHLANRLLADFIVQDKLLHEHLGAIIRGRKKSAWNCSDGMSIVLFEDDDQVDVVYSFLLHMLDTTPTETTVSDRMRYILRMLLPEATIYALAGVNKISLDEARRLYLQGAQYDQSEMEMVRQDLVNNLNKETQERLHLPIHRT